MTQDLGLETDADNCAELLKRAADGDASARGQLLLQHRAKLERMVAIRMDARLAQRIDASDVVQEATIEADRRLSEYLANPSMDFYLWLRWLTRERLIDLHREHLDTQKRDARREQSVQIDNDRSAAALANVLVGELTSPSNALEREQNRTIVRAAISQLAPIDREILVLRHFEQMSTSQAAEVLNLSKSGAGKRHVMALRKLKGILEDTMPADASRIRG